MKKLLAFLFTAVSAICISQLNYTEQYKLYESQISYIGGTEQFAYYLSWKYLTQTQNTEELTYFKVPMSGGEPQFFEKEKLKFGELNTKLLRSVVLDDIVYELYLLSKSSISSPVLQVALIKRQTDNFELIGEPKVVSDLPGWGIYSVSPINMFVDKDGIIVLSQLHLFDEKKCFVKRYDFGLNELWNVDISNFYSDDKEIVTRVTYDENEKMVFFELNLAECEDCDGFKMFKREKKYDQAIIGLMYINEKGEQIVTVPELPEGIIYSASRYFYDSEKDLVHGIYSTHKSTGSEYSDVTGFGYTFCQWERETGKLQSSTNHTFSYGEVITDDTKKLVSMVAPKESWADSDPYPRLAGGVSIYKLSDGSYILFAKALNGDYHDPIQNKSLSAALASSRFLAHLDSEGKLTWTKSIPFFAGSGIQGRTITKDDLLTFVSLGYKVNYSSGSFNLTDNEKSFDAYCITQIDLKTGEVVIRKQFEEKLFNNEYNSTVTQFNENANKFVFGLQSNSGSGFRKVAFGLVNLEKD